MIELMALGFEYLSNGKSIYCISISSFITDGYRESISFISFILERYLCRIWLFSISSRRRLLISRKSCSLSIPKKRRLSKLAAMPVVELPQKGQVSIRLVLWKP